MTAKWIKGLVAATFLAGLGAQAFAAPIGCQHPTARSGGTAPILGTWSARELDDNSTDWTGPFTFAFLENGTWTSDGDHAGSWCIRSDGILLFSFDDAPHTAFRAQVNARRLTGYESWDNGGTGLFEAQRLQ